MVLVSHDLGGFCGVQVERSAASQLVNLLQRGDVHITARRSDTPRSQDSVAVLDLEGFNSGNRSGIVGASNSERSTFVILQEELQASDISGLIGTTNGHIACNELT